MWWHPGVPIACEKSYIRMLGELMEQVVSPECPLQCEPPEEKHGAQQVSQTHSDSTESAPYSGMLGFRPDLW